MAVPKRVNLLRMQQIRGMGGNSWRMSHNPGSPSTFALGDALGMTFLDENRVYSDAPEDVANMRDMVRRDRVHPSILFYSFCVRQQGARAPPPPPPPPPHFCPHAAPFPLCPRRMRPGALARRSPRWTLSSPQRRRTAAAQ